jgi:PAS domain-containing protein
MSSREIEVILSRQWADSLSTAVFIVDPQGNLIFYNERAEALLGLRYEETGVMPVSEWSSIFTPKDDDGNILPSEELPLVKTLTFQRPAHGEFWIKSLKGKDYKISVTSFPIMGKPDRFLGGIAIFWKKKKK